MELLDHHVDGPENLAANVAECPGKVMCRADET